MDYYVWIQNVELDGEKKPYQKLFGLDAYNSIYEARTAAFYFANQHIEQVLNKPDFISCVVEIIASLEPNNELLIFSKKASKNKNVVHQGSLPENQIHKNLVRELEIYREENMQCDSTMSSMGGFVIK